MHKNEFDLLLLTLLATLAHFAFKIKALVRLQVLEETGFIRMEHIMWFISSDE